MPMMRAFLVCLCVHGARAFVTGASSPGICKRSPCAIFLQTPRMNALAPVDEAKAGILVAKSAFSRLLHLEGPKTAWQLSISKPKAASITFAAAIYFTIATMAPAFICVFLAKAVAGMAGAYVAGLAGVVYTVPQILNITLIYIAALMEDKGPREALERSKELMEGNKLAFITCSMAFSFAIELTNFIATGCIIRPFLLPLFGSPEVVAAGRGKAVAAALVAGIIAFGHWVVFGLGDFFVLSKTFYEHAKTGKPDVEAAP